MSKFSNSVDERVPRRKERDRVNDSRSLPLSYDFCFLNYMDAKHLGENLKMLREGVFADYKELSQPFLNDGRVRTIVKDVRDLVLSDISVDETFRNKAELHAWQKVARVLINEGLTSEEQVVEMGWVLLSASLGMFIADFIQSDLYGSTS